jgi:hypothetical protein
MYEIQFEHENGSINYETVNSKKAVLWWAYMAPTAAMYVTQSRILVGYKVKNSGEITWLN